MDLRTPQLQCAFVLLGQYCPKSSARNGGNIGVQPGCRHIPAYPIPTRLLIRYGTRGTLQPLNDYLGIKLAASEACGCPGTKMSKGVDVGKTLQFSPPPSEARVVKKAKRNIISQSNGEQDESSSQQTCFREGVSERGFKTSYPIAQYQR